MREKRWLYFALGVTTVISIGAVTNQLVPLAPATGVALSDTGITFPDGTVQTTAALQDPRPRFYVKSSGVPGNQVLTACDTGFHMASIYEILDPSNLRYDASRGFSFPDSGEGPPQSWQGWVRTGDLAGAPGGPVGLAACEDDVLLIPWSAGTDASSGTWVRLNYPVTAPWDSTATRTSPWEGGTATCDSLLGVWCVEDYPGSGA